MSERFKPKPQDSTYFRRFAKNIIVGTGISGLIAGGYMIWPSVIQYFHELTMAIQKGTVSPTEAAPLLCCMGPAVLGFGLLYRGFRKAKGSPSWDR